MTDLVALPKGTELAGDYRIERALGAGGFGITYLAEETPLARNVTIKEYFPVDFAARNAAEDVSPRSRDSESDYKWGLERFLEEAQTLAKFDHPNIVRVYRYFRARNTGYIVLHFEEGSSFKAWLKNLGRAPRQQELDKIIAPLLDALELIHAADFLHRDIAPDNIIIRKDGTPVLIDFGSARGEIAQHSKTVSALVKPGYSPYEQYATTGRQQGPWTDIYSLGATLYQAITGKRPPDAPSRMVAEEMIPVRDAALSSYRPGFLAAIDKALSLDINERPKSIAEWRKALLAPVEKAEKIQKSEKAANVPAASIASVGSGKNPDATPSAKPLAASLPAVGTAVISAGNKITSAFLDGWRKGAPAEQSEARAPSPAKPKKKETPPAAPPKAAKAVVAPKAKEPSAPAVPAKTEERRAPPRAIRAKPRWRALAIKLALGIGVASAAVAVQDRFPQIRHQGGGTILSQAGEIVPIGQLKGHHGAVSGIGFSSDGKLLATTAADGTIKVWNAATRALVGTLELDNGMASAFALDGTRAATGHKDGTIALWDIESGAKVATFKRNEVGIWSVAFAGESGRVAAGGNDGAVVLWDARSPAAPVHVFEGHEGPVKAIAYATRTTRIASGGVDKTVHVWNIESGTALRVYSGHPDAISALAFAPDGRSLASGSLDGQITIWSTLSNRVHRALRGHRGPVTALAFASDGETLGTASEDGAVRLWDVRRSRVVRTFNSGGGELKAISFSPDGRRIAAGGADGLVRIWDAAIPKPAS